MPSRNLSASCKPTAVIVGFEANGLGVARALARHGAPCIALALPWANPCCHTNTCTVIHGREWSADALVEDLIQIGKRLLAKAPLLLTKDQAVLWVSDAREELSEFFEIALPDRQTVDLLMNKLLFLKLAQSEGWPVPRTWMVESKDALLALRSEFIYPCILKPQVKNDLFRRHSPKKAFKIANQQELLEAYDLVATWEKEVVIQEWIEGSDERIGFCLGYCDRGAVPRALFPGRKLIQWPIGFGNTAISEPAPIDWREPMLDLTRQVWMKVGYRGLGSMEFKVRPDTNSPVIMEPTVGRTDFQSELAVLNGVNIPLIAYCDLAGLDARLLRESQPPTKLVDGPSHLRAARVLMAQSGRQGLQKWLKARTGRKRYMIFRAGDFQPFLHSIYGRVRSMVGSLLQKLIGGRLKSKLAAWTPR